MWKDSWPLKRIPIVVLVGCALAACGDGGDSSDSSSSSGNKAPTISGSPPSSVAQGAQYQFRPSATDPDGDVLTFDIDSLPAWATFDSSDGAISGTPGQSDLGTYSNITISVSDGQHTVSLNAFSIDVVAVGDLSVTLNWTAPTERTDGSPLTDLAGYKIYWSTSPDNYPHSTRLDNPGLTSYVVEGLTPATWYFVATAFDSNGVESGYSNPASKTVN